MDAQTIENAIVIRDLVKCFGPVRAVDTISFTVGKGSTTALLGGNGAGKTTTLSMLLGVLLPTFGSIRVLGVDMVQSRYAALQRMNFSSPYVDLPRRLSVMENLLVYARLYSVADPKARIAALAEELQVSDFLKRPVGELSAGQKTRVVLAKALLNEPDVLLLDEPTASLDPDTGDWVRSYLEFYRQQTGATIVIASHNMGEVERLCDQVLMMRAGKIADRGSPQSLRDRYGRQSLEEVFLDIVRDRVRPSARPEAFETAG